jgi:hypothetical protein
VGRGGDTESQGTAAGHCKERELWREDPLRRCTAAGLRGNKSWRNLSMSMLMRRPIKRGRGCGGVKGEVDAAALHGR